MIKKRVQRNRGRGEKREGREAWGDIIEVHDKLAWKCPHVTYLKIKQFCFLLLYIGNPT